MFTTSEGSSPAPLDRTRRLETAKQKLEGIGAQTEHATGARCCPRWEAGGRRQEEP